MSPSNQVPHLSVAAANRERRLLRSPACWLHEELAKQMAQRLTILQQPPTSWLDWMPSWGGESAEASLAAVLPLSKRKVYEPGHDGVGASRWWRKLMPSSVWDGQSQLDMVWANMGLRSVVDPEPLLVQWRQALVPGGLLMFSALGPRSLLSIREIYARHGWGEPATPFVDMHDWGDQLVQSGFADPVMDASFIDLTYSSAEALLSDLRTMGRNTHDQRYSACRTTAWRQQLSNALTRELPRDEQGRLLVRLEVVWGHAWRATNALSTGEKTAISEADMRAMLQRNIQK